VIYKLVIYKLVIYKLVIYKLVILQISDFEEWKQDYYICIFDKQLFEFEMLKDKTCSQI